MEKPADALHPVHALIGRRWSPHAFDARPVESATLLSLLEAARWAPSSYNEQPWAFVVATKDRPAEFDKMLNCLVDGNIAWAQNAPVLMISLARLKFARNGNDNRHAYHDVGQAVAGLTVQATALGLVVHQMAGILVDKIRQEYALPADVDPVAGVAVGYPGDPAALPEGLKQRETAPRSRKPVESFVFSGKWGESR